MYSHTFTWIFKLCMVHDHKCLLDKIATLLYLIDSIQYIITWLNASMMRRICCAQMGDLCYMRISNAANSAKSVRWMMEKMIRERGTTHSVCVCVREKQHNRLVERVSRIYGVSFRTNCGPHPPPSAHPQPLLVMLLSPADFCPSGPWMSTLFAKCSAVICSLFI